MIAPPDDPREGVVVTLEEREVALLVMRQNLENLHEIMAAMGTEDRARVATLAREAVKMPGPGRRVPALRAKLPDGWRAISKNIKISYTKLATAAEDPEANMAAPLSEATAACVACHASYRLDLQL